jgi:predicted lipoprotein with Yx(FWY)xxD motif
VLPAVPVKEMLRSGAPIGSRRSARTERAGAAYREMTNQTLGGIMRSRTIAVLGLAGAAFLAACGGGSYGSSKSAAPAAPVATHTTAAATAVNVRHTQLGDVLVNGDGRTLYAFTDDAAGTSTCNGACAALWPHVSADNGWKRGANVTTTFRATTRNDGSKQLATSKWPLYVYSGDQAAGDVNGEGLFGKWFAVRPDGTMLKTATSATTPASSGMGY